MREIWLVCRREFRERVQARSFLIGTLVFPLFVGGIMLLPLLIGGGGEERTVVLVDETPEGFGEPLAAALGREPDSEDANRYVVEVVRGDLENHQAELTGRVEAEEIHGYLVLPGDLLEGNSVRYRSTTIASPGMLRDLRLAVSETVQAERLRRAGLEGPEVAELIRPVVVENARITVTGEERGDAQSTFWMAYVLAFVIYFMVFFYGVHVMRSVLEEKTSRIAEVLVSSLKATHLMAGKILGVAGAALLQVLIWGALIAILITQSDLIAQQMGIEPEMLRALEVDAGPASLLLAFFLVGFFLYAAMFAALGAAVTSEQEAQSFQMVLIIPLFVPLMFLVPLTSEPLGQAATFLGLFPLTSPVAMPMRLASAPIPPTEVAISLVLLTVSLGAVAWIAGKIYRIGILATGKRPTLRELGRWLRTA